MLARLEFVALRCYTLMLLSYPVQSWTEVQGSVMEYEVVVLHP